MLTGEGYEAETGTWCQESFKYPLKFQAAFSGCVRPLESVARTVRRELPAGRFTTASQRRQLNSLGVPRRRASTQDFPPSTETSTLATLPPGIPGGMA